MVASAVLFILIGTIPHMPAISAPVAYEPIKIIINEHFNTQPAPVIQKLPSLVPSFVHQGANFYFNPQLNLSPGHILYYIKKLLSSIHQKPEFIRWDTLSELILEKDKLTEVVKPVGNPLPALISQHKKEVLGKRTVITEVSTPTQIEAIKEDSLEELLPTQTALISNDELKPLTPELAVIPAAPVLPLMSFDGILKIEEEKFGQNQPSQSKIIINDEAKHFTSELAVMPEAPVLPPLSFDSSPSVVTENPNTEEPILWGITKPMEIKVIKEENIDASPSPQPTIIINDEANSLTPELAVISAAPVLPPLSFDANSPVITADPKIEEPILLEELKPILIEVIKEENLEEPLPPYPSVIINDEAKPLTPELAIISAAPSFDAITPMVVADPKIEQPILLEESKPILIEIIEEKKFEQTQPSHSTIIINDETKHFIPEAIPEAPLLPPLSFDSFPPIVIEDPNTEQPILSKVPKPIQIVVIKEENLEVPLPPQTTIIINDGTNSLTPELAVISAAPVLPPLSFDAMPPMVVADPKIEKPILSDEPKPVLIEVIKEENFGQTQPSQSTIIMNDETKHFIPEAIPEAPLLPPLSFDSFPPIVIEDPNTEEPILSEVPKPIQIDVIKEENLKVPLPPQPTVIINDEVNSLTPELAVISAAPVLPPLSFEAVPPMVVANPKIEEPILLEEPKPILIEIIEEEKFGQTQPSHSTIIINDETKHFIPEAIPEAPLLPPLSFDSFPPIVIEDPNTEQPILSKVPKPIQIGVIKEENLEVPLPPQPTIIINDETNSLTPELAVISAAPVLPPLSFDAMPPMVVADPKIEKPILLDEPKPVLSEVIKEEKFGQIQPSQATIVIDDETKHFTLELAPIPEGPVLAPLSFDSFPPIVIEDLNTEKPILSEVSKPIQIEVTKEGNLEVPLPPQPTMIITDQAKPLTQELAVIPAAPVLPPLSFDVITPAVVNDPKTKEPILLEESKPILIEVIKEENLEELLSPQPSIIINDEAKSLTPVITSAASFDASPSMAVTDPKIEEPILLEESEPIKIKVIKEKNTDMPPLRQPLIVTEYEPRHNGSKLTAFLEAPLLPPLSSYSVSPVDIDDPKIEEAILSEVSKPILIEVIKEESFPEPNEPKHLTPKLGVISPSGIPLLSYHVSPPVGIEFQKIEKPLLEEKVEVFPRIQKISTRPRLEPLATPDVTDSFEITQRSPLNISKSQKILRVFDSVPPVKQLSSPIPMIKNKYVIPKFKEHFLLQRAKEQLFRLPLFPFSKFPVKLIRSPKFVEKHPFLYSSSRLYNILKKSPRHVIINNTRSKFQKGNK